LFQDCETAVGFSEFFAYFVLVSYWEYFSVWSSYSVLACRLQCHCRKIF